MRGICLPRISVLGATLLPLLLSFDMSRAAEFPAGRLVDLTHSFSEETVYWPTATAFDLDTVFVGSTEKGFYYEAYEFSAAEHGGTHVDAPIHFAAGRWTVDEIPLDRLIGPAVVVDVSSKALDDADYQIGVNDLTSWESTNDLIPDGAIVLLHTGYYQYWPDRARYMGTAERGAAAVSKLHFPGLDPTAARWLVKNRRIAAIGLDTPSIDYGQSELFESHRVLFERNIPAFENLADLGSLPPTGTFIIALPMKIRNGSGAPLRIVAIVPNDEE